MAHTPGYKYDVFLSYSQANNSEDWVTRLADKLAARLRERLSNNVEVFRDKQVLQGNQELTPTLRDTVRNSAVFLPVVSRNYLTRPWCLQECQTFLAANAGRPGRIFPVRYDDEDPLSCALDGLLVIDPRDESTMRRFVTGLRQLGRNEATS